MSEIYLNIPYHHHLVPRVRQLPGVHWNQKLQLWQAKDGKPLHEAIIELGLTAYLVARPQGHELLCSASAKTHPIASPLGGALADRQVPPLERPIDSEAVRVAFEEMMMREGAAQATIKSYQSALRMFAEWWGRPLNVATREDLLCYLTYCLKEKQYSRASMNQVVNAVSAYYARVLEWPKDELRLPRPRKKRSLPNVCSEAQALGLLRGVRNLKHKTILTLIYALGLRKGEVQGLFVSHVDLDRGVICVLQPKDNKERQLELQSTLAQLLERYIQAYKPTQWLFEGQTGGQYSATSIQTIFVKAKAASEAPDHLTLHGLRHSCATHMVERGTPLHVVKELLGHETIQTTQIYLHTSSKRIDDVYDPLAGL